jgi:hypothetical protein
MLDAGIAREEASMATKYVLEDVSIVDNNFSADSRDKDGLRIVSFDLRRSIKLHLAIDHIVQIEAVKDAKLDEGRSIVTMTSGHRYIARSSAVDLCAAIDKAGTA